MVHNIPTLHCAMALHTAYFHITQDCLAFYAIILYTLHINCWRFAPNICTHYTAISGASRPCIYTLHRGLSHILGGGKIQPCFWYYRDTKSACLPILGHPNSINSQYFAILRPQKILSRARLN